MRPRAFIFHSAAELLRKGRSDMKRKSITRAVRNIICLLFIFQAYSAYPAGTENFSPGSELPQFTVGAPDSREVQEYLGLKNDGPFSLSDIAAKMVLIDFTNSSWHVCQENAPVVNRLYHFIQGKPALRQDIRVVGIAILDNKARVDDFKTKFEVPFPIFPDEQRKIYSALKQPVVPSIMLVTGGGKVLMKHNGLIKNFDGIVKKLLEICEKQ
jgi:peroxiredoxin